MSARNRYLGDMARDKVLKNDMRMWERKRKEKKKSVRNQLTEKEDKVVSLHECSVYTLKKNTKRTQRQIYNKWLSRINAMDTHGRVQHAQWTGIHTQSVQSERQQGRQDNYTVMPLRRHRRRLRASIPRAAKLWQRSSRTTTKHRIHSWQNQQQNKTRIKVAGINYSQP